MLVLLAALLFSGNAPEDVARPSDLPVRVQRRIGVSLSPDLLVLHPQKYPDQLANPFMIRSSISLTSRIALTAAVGWNPLLTSSEAGLRVALCETPLTPYVGADAGVLRWAADDTPGRTSLFAAGTVGVGYAARNGIEAAAEGGLGWASDQDGPLLARVGLRLGYRIDIGI